ncbi:hypothetical protein KIN20_034424 [Parelaphostrongylus tenuis]|uniref:Uncharacterized protein n=1 Tax=Parelaphostrongylus tenuis TaxID=148309 RepID=A0AAD5RAB7_PARTN|nr:hypothetical protein KIN20_034424 [Parelaphostrongylus tenuis]
MRVFMTFIWARRSDGYEERYTQRSTRAVREFPLARKKKTKASHAKKRNAVRVPGERDRESSISCRSGSRQGQMEN